jgi:hypothetical protein
MRIAKGTLSPALVCAIQTQSLEIKMSYTFVKSAFIIAALSAGPAFADTGAQTTLPEPAAAHYGQCSDTTTFVSAHCAALQRANLERIRDCMAMAPASSQGYRARYLLCNAEVNRTLGQFGG